MNSQLKKINSLLYNSLTSILNEIRRPVFSFIEDSGKILTDNSQTQQLDPAQK